MNRLGKHGWWLGLVLSGCMVGPDYKPPAPVVANQWSSDEAVAEPPRIDWWLMLDDALLTKYVETAMKHNNTLLVAEANILQARALRKIEASSLFPQLGGDLNATKTYFSKNGPVFAGGSLIGGTSAATGLPFQIQIPQIQNLFNALLDASWEIDLFGKNRRGVEAADAYIGSVIEQKNDVLVSMLAELARNYIELRSFQKQAKIVQDTISLLTQESAIVQKQWEVGYANLLSLDEIQAQLASVQADLPNIHAQIYRSIFALAVLTGSVPETLLDELLPEQALPQIPQAVAVGLRSDLLRRRPDVRRSERQLAAATANIGVAVASFYPSFTLIGDGGFQSLHIKNLLRSASKTWGYGGDVQIPIFQGGSLIGNLRASEAIAAAAAYSYQQTVLTALQETESALIAYQENLEASKKHTENRDLNQKLVDLTEARYNAGYDDLLALLTKQQQLNRAELILLESDTATLLDLVALYKALGGGWEKPATIADQPQSQSDS